MNQPSLYELIETFNYGYGVIKTIPPELDESTRTFMSCIAMIESEVDELEKALAENDKPEILDALGDMIYLIIGLGVRTGVRLEPGFPEVIFPIVHWSRKTEERVKQWKEVLSTFRETLNGTENVPSKIWKDSFQIMLDDACRSLTEYGTNYYQVVKFIHQSNMNKFASSEAHARESVEAYRTWVSPTGERYSSPAYRPGPDGRWVIYDQEKNKVLKAKGWTAPNLSHFVRF